MACCDNKLGSSSRTIAIYSKGRSHCATLVSLNYISAAMISINRYGLTVCSEGRLALVLYLASDGRTELRI